MKKQSSTCTNPELKCIGWMDDKGEWLKCRICGYMVKVKKTIIKPVGDNNG